MHSSLCLVPGTAKEHGKSVTHLVSDGQKKNFIADTFVDSVYLLEILTLEIFLVFTDV